MSVLHAEAGQENLGIAVWYVVTIPIRIKQQVGNVEYEHAVVTECKTCRQIQPIDEVPAAIHVTITVGVFEDRDTVGTFRSVRRWFWNAVVFRP